MFTCVRPLQTCVGHVFATSARCFGNIFKVVSEVLQMVSEWIETCFGHTFQACFSFEHGFKMIQIYFGNYLVTCHHNHRQQTNIKHDVTKTSNRIPENAPTRLTRPADGGWRNAALPLPLGTILKPYFLIPRPKHFLVR